MPENAHLSTALHLAAEGVPVLPLQKGKVPFANCPACLYTSCGGRPHMKTPGPCTCPRPCHGWAAATINTTTLNSPQWATRWREAGSVAYHPGGAGLTVLDLDHADAIAWARQTLPATRTVPTTRGEHWIYQGTMPSANAVRPGVDIKSLMQYARWLGPGTGTPVPLPDAVRALTERSHDHHGPGGESTVAGRRWDRAVASGCRHTERYIRHGLARGVAKVRGCREAGAGSQAFGVAKFLATQHRTCPGPCDLDGIGADIISAAVAVGVPEAYAARAVQRGFATAGVEVTSS